MSYERDLIETEEIGDYRIKIYPDYDAGCPVKDWDMGAIHLFEHLDHCRRRISSECDWKELVYDNPHQYDLQAMLERLAAEVVEQDKIIKYLKDGKVNGSRFVYNRSERQWELQYQADYAPYKGEWMCQFEVSPSELKAYDYRRELVEGMDTEELVELISTCAKDFVIKHWSSRGYSQGDYMEGISYMSKEQFDKRCGFSSKHYKTWQEQAMAVIEGEVKCIEIWAWGDVKGFVLEKKVSFTKVYDDDDRPDEEDEEWEEVDSCWGYYMETDELIQEVIAEHGLKQTA